MSAHDQNRGVVEVETLRPRLRDGLRFSVQEQTGGRVCVIEDCEGSRFHRAGLEEYRFIRALDGTRTVASILAQFARDGGGESFTEAEAVQILRWLKDNHLLVVESGRAGGEREAAQRSLMHAMSWLNPLTIRIPLARPDRFFAAIEPRLRWALGGAGFIVWLLVVLTGAGHVAMNWPRFERDFDGILARENWLWLLLVWAVLKLVHELAHGLFCKHFGAAVREMGMMLVVFMPMGYVDATASIGLASKWQRIGVACAGMYAEFFLAAISAVVWARSGDGLVANVAHNAVFTGTVVTLFFNANPLMRFDSYYVLAELLGIPNLATRGRAWMHSALSWLCLGASSKPSVPHGREEWCVALYGIGAAVWQIVVSAGLLAGAAVALRGGGLFFAVCAAAMWLASPLWRLAKTLSPSSGTVNWRTAGWRLAALASLAGAALFLPFHRSVSSPGVVELADTIVLRAECPGFVEKVHVHDGELVEAGQLLVSLANDEASTALARSRIEHAGQQMRSQVARAKKAIAESQAEQAKADALKTTAANNAAYLATLEIRAPFAGRVMGRNLDRIAGAFLQNGEEIVRLGRADSCDVKIALDQESEPHFRDAGAAPLRVRIEGRSGAFDATLTRVEARATRELIDPALTVLGGGPLALRRIEQSAADDPNAGNDAPAFELAEPHFAAVARLENSEPMSAGQIAHVKLQSPRAVNLWELAQGALGRWLKRYADQG